MFSRSGTIAAAIVIAIAQFPAASAAGAQPFEDSLARIRAAAAPGDRVTVVDGNDRAISGVMLNLSNGTLVLRSRSGVQEIPVQDVQAVQKSGDSPWNGFLIGAVLGASLGFSTFEECDPVPPMKVCGGNLTRNRGMETAAVAGLFGALGLTIDVFRQGTTTVYRGRSAASRKVGISASRAGIRTQFSVAF